MKKLLSSILILAVIAGISGCGDNKTKEKLIGTAVYDSTSAGGGSSFLASPDATSMTALYKATFMGGGAGEFAMSAPSRYGAPAMSRAPSSEGGLGLGSPNALGEYNVADQLGMTVKVKFKSGSDTVIMDFSKVYTGNSLYVYEAENLNGTSHLLSAGVSQGDVISWLTSAGGALHVPSIWQKLSGAPLAWFTVNQTVLQNNLSGLETFMMSHFPDTMENGVSGSVPGGTLNMTMTTAMPSGRPSDAAPTTMTGSGTVTFDTGEVWTLTQSMQVGTNGPVGGSMSYTSTTGETGTMTFHANGTMDGVQTMNGATVGTIHINADGTGSYTDKDGTVYAISGARPA